MINGAKEHFLMQEGEPNRCLRRSTEACSGVNQDQPQMNIWISKNFQFLDVGNIRECLRLISNAL